MLCPVTYNYVYLIEEVKDRISKEILPKLCLDKPKLKELDLKESQVETLVSNFRFILKNKGIQLKIDDLNPKFVKEIKKTVSALY